MSRIGSPRPPPVRPRLPTPRGEARASLANFGGRKPVEKVGGAQGADFDPGDRPGEQDAHGELKTPDTPNPPAKLLSFALDSALVGEIALPAHFAPVGWSAGAGSR